MTRTCEGCGQVVAPSVPRKKVANRMLGECCQHTASATSHPDLKASVRTAGTAHVTGGRVLPPSGTQREASEVDPWQIHSLHQPVSSAIDAGRSYASSKGLSDPHSGVDYHDVRTNPQSIDAVGKAYDSLPKHDAKAMPHFHAMGREVADQFHHLTNNLGVHVQFVDHDPYPHAGAMMDDLRDNNRLQVLKTSTTGKHPVFSDHLNDKFRAVHDYFGHAATGRDFDRHGEEAAYLAHSRLFTPDALPAMASETKGQNSSFILNGGRFPTQKAAILPSKLWTPSRKGDFMKSASTDMRKVAHDSGDGETIYHCPFCGSGQVIARSDRTIECEFCHVHFTVQVQPQYPAFPQTINGQPVQVPGMPGMVGPSDPMGGGMPPGQGAAGAPPGMDPNAPVDPSQIDAQGDVDGGDDSGDDSGDDEDDDKPAFLKGSMLRTTAGHLLPEEEYVHHLAIRHAADPRAMAAQVKARR